MLGRMLFSISIPLKMINDWWGTLPNYKREIIKEGSMTFAFFSLAGLTIFMALLILTTWLTNSFSLWMLYLLPISVYRPVSNWISKTLNPFIM